MTTVIEHDDGEWQKRLFTDAEIRKLRQAERFLVEAQAELDEHIGTIIAPEVLLDPEDAVAALDGIRDVLNDSELHALVSDTLFATGVAICAAYLSDQEWLPDDEMATHLVFFGLYGVDDVDDDDEGEDDDETV